MPGLAFFLVNLGAQPTHRREQPTHLVGLPASVKHFWKTLRPAQSFVSILSHIRWTVKRSHSRYFTCEHEQIHQNYNPRALEEA